MESAGFFQASDRATRRILVGAASFHATSEHRSAVRGRRSTVPSPSNLQYRCEHLDLTVHRSVCDFQDVSCLPNRPEGSAALHPGFISSARPARKPTCLNVSLGRNAVVRYVMRTTGPGLHRAFPRQVYQLRYAICVVWQQIGLWPELAGPPFDGGFRTRGKSLVTTVRKLLIRSL